MVGAKHGGSYDCASRFHGSWLVGWLAGFPQVSHDTVDKHRLPAGNLKGCSTTSHMLLRPSILGGKSTIDDQGSSMIPASLLDRHLLRYLASGARAVGALRLPQPETAGLLDEGLPRQDLVHAWVADGGTPKKLLAARLLLPTGEQTAACRKTSCCM